MKRIISALALVAFSVAACGGDDDGDDGDNGGTSGSGATSGNAGEPSGTDGGAPVENNGGTDGGGGAPASPNVMCDPEADGVCQNPMDCPYVVSGEARLTAGACGRSCLLGGGDDPDCPLDCMLVEEGLDMSSECATCYSDAAMCGIMNCAAQCIDDPEAEMCVACLEENNCRSAFNDCSGLEQ